MNKIEGGCLCGKIKYYSKLDPIIYYRMPLFTLSKNNQEQFFLLSLVVNRKSLHISGDLKCYEDIGNSGKPVYRKFCGNCGSPIISDVSAVPDLLFIKAGTINNIKAL